MIDSELVEKYKKSIADLIDEQRIGPELRIQDFDNYVCLLNGEVIYMPIFDWVYIMTLGSSTVTHAFFQSSSYNLLLYSHWMRSKLLSTLTRRRRSRSSARSLSSTWSWLERYRPSWRAPSLLACSWCSAETSSARCAAPPPGSPTWCWGRWLMITRSWSKST